MSRRRFWAFLAIAIYVMLITVQGILVYSGTRPSFHYDPILLLPLIVMAVYGLGEDKDENK